MQPSLIEIITAFVRASGLRRKDLLCLRRCHIVDDPFSEEILIVYHREGLDRDHIIPILLDHENVVLYLLKQHQNDNDPWFPIVFDEVDYEAARRYYVQQLYEQAKQFQSPFLRKKVLTWIAEILEEPLYGLVKRYKLDGEWAKQDQIQMPAFSDFGDEPWIPQGPFLDEPVNTEEDKLNRRIHRRPRSRRLGMTPTPLTEDDLDERSPRE